MRLVKDASGRILYTTETRKPKPKIRAHIEFAFNVLLGAIMFWGSLILILLCA